MSDFVFTEEILADGQILDVAVSSFLKSRAKEDLYKALVIFRSSKLLVPCRVTSYSKDDSANNGILYVPELITNGDGYYFIPVFSNVKYMERFNSDSGVVKVNKPVTEIIELAKANTKIELEGLVLNPFDQSFIITRNIWDSILKMESLIK